MDHDCLDEFIFSAANNSFLSCNLVHVDFNREQVKWRSLPFHFDILNSNLLNK